MKVKKNQTVVDVTFDLCGSLAGLPSLLSQLEGGKRIGFETLPEVWNVIDEVGQTWTPDLQDLTLSVELPIYNALAVKKKPYGTDILPLQKAIEWGNTMLKTFLSTESVTDSDEGYLVDDNDNYLII